MGVKEKYNEFLCHLLYRLDNINISPTWLKSIDKDNPVPQRVLDLLKSERYLPYIKKYEESIIYVETEKNPTGINKYCREYAINNGQLNYRKEQWKDKATDSYKEVSIIDNLNPYTSNDPEELRIILLDNAANLSKESNLSKGETIDKMSKYFVELRNIFGYTPVLIQHQALC
jgi:hypothetical protein